MANTILNHLNGGKQQFSASVAVSHQRTRLSLPMIIPNLSHYASGLRCFILGKNCSKHGLVAHITMFTLAAPR